MVAGNEADLPGREKRTGLFLRLRPALKQRRAHAGAADRVAHLFIGHRRPGVQKRFPLGQRGDHLHRRYNVADHRLARNDLGQHLRVCLVDGVIAVFPQEGQDPDHFRIAACGRRPVKLNGPAAETARDLCEALEANVHNIRLAPQQRHQLLGCRGANLFRGLFFVNGLRLLV